MAGSLAGDGVSPGSSFVGADDVLSGENDKETPGEAVTVVVMKIIEGGGGGLVVVTKTVFASTFSSAFTAEAGEELMVNRTSSLGMAVSVVILNPPIPFVFDIAIKPGAVGSEPSIVITFVLVVRTLSTSTVEMTMFS